MYVVLFIFSNFNCEKQVNASALLFWHIIYLFLQSLPKNFYTPGPSAAM